MIPRTKSDSNAAWVGAALSTGRPERRRRASSSDVLRSSAEATWAGERGSRLLPISPWLPRPIRRPRLSVEPAAAPSRGSQRGAAASAHSGVCACFSSELDEMLGMERQELRLMFEGWLHRMERRRQEHLGRQKDVLHSLLREPTTLPGEPLELLERSSPEKAKCTPPGQVEVCGATQTEDTEGPSEKRAPSWPEQSCQAHTSVPESTRPFFPAPGKCDIEAGERLEGVASTLPTAPSSPQKNMSTREAWTLLSTPKAASTSTEKPLYLNSWRYYIKPNAEKRRKTSGTWRIIDEGTTGKTPMQKLTRSRYYEWFSGVLILLNAVFIGYQTEWIARSACERASQGLPPLGAEPISFLVFQGSFFVLFSVELACRWVADGAIGYFQTSELRWNIFDLIVVFVSFLDMVFAIAQRVTSADVSLTVNVSVLRVARMIRIIRVAKVIRVMRFFRELRMMIYSILGSVKALLWSIAVLFLMFFIFGISLTIGTIYHLETIHMWQAPDTEKLRQYFGTLARSVLSLYMAMSGGKSWGDFMEVLVDMPSGYSMLFLMFVTITIFAVGNVVTGIFVENAMQSRQTDKEVLVQEEMDAKQKYFEEMKEVFDELDDDQSGYFTLEDFEAKLTDERVVACFNVLNLDISDARMLFTLLDYDQSGEVAIEEFLAGCHKLKGESRNLDLAVVQFDVHCLKEAFVAFVDCCMMDTPTTMPKLLKGAESSNNTQNVARLWEALHRSESPAGSESLASLR